MILQAFFAGVEMAVISCSRIKVRHKAEMGERRARIVQWFLDEPRNLLATTLVGYNLAVVIGSCVLNNFISRYAPPHTENLFSLIIYLPLVLILGQIVPMAYGRQYANSLCLALARPLRIAYYALFPLVFSASLLGMGITRIFTRGRSKKNPFVTREEIELLLKESHEAGMLRGEEREMIEEIFYFGEKTARHAMLPLIDIVAAPETATVGEVRKLIAEAGHSRIPIYRGRIDTVIGTIHATDLIGLPAEKSARDVMRPPFIVPESARIEAVLAELQRNNKQMAIVADEYGGISGMLTLEDIVEEIVGEIDDEYDADNGAEWEKSAESIIVDGRMRIDDFNDEFGQHIPEDECETIGGFVINLLGKIPAAGVEVSYEQLTFRVTEATDRRVTRLSVKGVR
jgi:CBS domain containing-hemolysin-like protein